MHVRQLSLTNFRLYARLELELPAGPLLLVGANAQGKTSLLEALYYLATAQSHHATSDRQLIHFLALHEALPFAKIVAEVVKRDEIKRIEIRLIQETISNGEARLRKEVFINGAKKKVGELAGVVNVVLFLPHDLAIVEGAPADRRRYVDIALCQTDAAYNFALGEYAKVLTQRNALLKLLQENPGHSGAEAQMEFWDEKLCEQGALILEKRAAALFDLEALASALHRDLTGGAESLRLAYHPAFDPAAPGNGQMGLPLDVPVHRVGIPAEEIRAGLRGKLKAARAEEIARGATLFGPHRDEIRFIAGGMDLGTYGSRGQARTAVLALKLAEMAWMKNRTGEWPILLLDEVLAELDVTRRRDLLNRLTRAEQCVLTTTDLNLFPAEFQGQSHVWRVEAGRVV
jgi:DNA replication and repair protein RecF